MEYVHPGGKRQAAQHPSYGIPSIHSYTECILLPNAERGSQRGGLIAEHNWFRGFPCYNGCSSCRVEKGIECAALHHEHIFRKLGSSYKVVAAVLATTP